MLLLGSEEIKNIIFAKKHGGFLFVKRSEKVYYSPAGQMQINVRELLRRRRYLRHFARTQRAALCRGDKSARPASPLQRFGFSFSLLAHYTHSVLPAGWASELNSNALDGTQTLFARFAFSSCSSAPRVCIILRAALPAISLHSLAALPLLSLSLSLSLSLVLRTCSLNKNALDALYWDLFGAAATFFCLRSGWKFQKMR
jgi:hypothetical protein